MKLLLLTLSYRCKHECTHLPMKYTIKLYRGRADFKLFVQPLSSFCKNILLELKKKFYERNNHGRLARSF